MAILTDLSPLRRSRAFRLLYVGNGVSFIGSQVTAVTAPFQLFELTNSTLQVALLSLAQLPALFAGSLFGGPIADAYDRRRVLLFVETAMLAASAGLAVNALLPHPHVGAIYLLTAAIAGLSGIEAPTRSACIPAMVGVEDLPGAMVLNQVEYQVGGVVGPLLGGFLIASVSEASAYWFDVATFVIALVFVVRLDPQIPSGGGTRPGLGSLAEGWRYLRGARDVQGTFVIDVNAMVFGMPRALFPEMARSTFGGGASVYGLLQAAPAAGAIVGAAGAGWVGRVDRQGRAVFIAVAVWGAALVLFGFSPWLWTALILLAIAGWADAISAIFRNTIMQLSVPDALRGRISAIHIAVVTGGPRLGDLESGGVATLTNVRVAAWTGGAACIAGCGLVARLWPELQAWRLSREGRAMAQGLSP